MRGINPVLCLLLLLPFCTAVPSKNLLQCHDCLPIATTFCDLWSCLTPEIEIVPGPVGNCLSARVTCPTNETSEIITEEGIILAGGVNPVATLDCTNDGWFSVDVQGVEVILASSVRCQAM